MGHFGASPLQTRMSQTTPPLYTGQFRHSLDDKNRLTIPSGWRFAHGENDVFLATPHPDGYIAVLPPAEVEKLRAKIAAIPLSDSAGQDFAARFFAQTVSLWFDKQGRMNLSAELLQHAGITKDAVLVGSLTKFNIYNSERWEKSQARASGENFGDLMRRMGI